MSNGSTIEKKMEELEEKIAWFHSDKFSLSEAAERYEEVDALAVEIEAQLEDTKQKIEILQQKFDQ